VFISDRHPVPWLRSTASQCNSPSGERSGRAGGDREVTIGGDADYGAQFLDVVNVV